MLSTKSEFVELPLDGDGILPEVMRGASEHDHDYTHRAQSRKR